MDAVLCMPLPRHCRKMFLGGDVADSARLMECHLSDDVLSLDLQREMETWKVEAKTRRFVCATAMGSNVCQFSALMAR